MPEIISEIVPQNRKRGRPRKFAYEELVHVAQKFKMGCERMLQNRVLMMRAIEVLGLEKKWNWYGIDERGEMMKAGRKNRLRKTVLAELGRIIEDDQLRFMAAMVVASNPANDRAAIKMLRAARLAKKMSFGSSELASLLWRVTKKYRRQHPQFSWPDTQVAVANLSIMLPDSAFPHWQQSKKKRTPEHYHLG